MPLESATYIHQLVSTNPVGATDVKAQGDDHIRLLKATLQATFPGITGAVTVTHTQLNAVGASGVTGMANPSALIGLAAVNGAATTVMRSDAAPALSQAIAPFWSDKHTFASTVGPEKIRLVAAAGINLGLYGSFYRNDNATCRGYWGYGANNNNTFEITNEEVAGAIRLQQLGAGTIDNYINGTNRLSITNVGATLTGDLSITGQANATNYFWSTTGRIGCGASDGGAAGAMYCSNWFRSYGATGWYNETYGGGIYMEDASSVRVSGGKHFMIPAGGNLYSTGDVIAFYSDDRLKTRTGKIENALDKVRSLEGFQYIQNDTARKLGYKDDSLQVGLSAQALQKVLPEVVKLAPIDMDPRGLSKSGNNYLTVNYERIVPLLVEAIKELANKAGV